MRDAFVDFPWLVAPDFAWKVWRTAHRPPLVVSSKDWARLEPPKLTGGATPEGAWAQADQIVTSLAQRTGPVLTAVDPAHAHERRPLQHATLVEEFAAIDYRDTASIAAFAKTYGALGLVPQQQRVLVRGKAGRPPAYDYTRGESHFAWAREISLAREALHHLKRLGPVEPRGGFERRRRLKWLFDRQLRHVAGRLSFDEEGDPKLAVAPITLLSAMWLKLALSLTGTKQFVACKFCDRVFEISTDEHGRSDREFCSGACRTKDYRRRKRSARQLAARGLPLDAIAKQVGTTEATVRKWLGQTPTR